MILPSDINYHRPSEHSHVRVEIHLQASNSCQGHHVNSLEGTQLADHYIGDIVTVTLFGCTSQLRGSSHKQMRVNIWFENGIYIEYYGSILVP